MFDFMGDPENATKVTHKGVALDILWQYVVKDTEPLQHSANYLKQETFKSTEHNSREKMVETHLYIDAYFYVHYSYM